MNVYDFDKTIYRRDCSVDFFLYCIKTRPRALACAPRMLSAWAQYRAGRIDKTEMKSRVFSFLSALRDTEAAVEAFWDTHIGGIQDWYLAQQRPDDLIISASPAFLVRPACARIGISQVLGSEVDPHTGRFLRANCHDEEKVRRFYEAYPDGVADAFYSDSLSDLPLARIAKCAYRVYGSRVEPWDPAAAR